jgi:hypothetical protein
MTHQHRVSEWPSDEHVLHDQSHAVLVDCSPLWSALMCEPGGRDYARRR